MSVQRSAILRQLREQQAHVVLCAPTGYGKSEVLRQFAAELKLSVQGCTPDLDAGRLLENAPHLVLLDSGDCLAAEELGRLLNHDPLQTRVVLACRHLAVQNFAHLLLRSQVVLLSAADLAFSEAELLAYPLEPEQAERVMEVTLGWPALVSLYAQPLVDPSAYLHALYENLPEALQAFVVACSHEVTWPVLPGVAHPGVAELLKVGFPVIPVSSTLQVHRAVREYIESEVAPLRGYHLEGLKDLQAIFEGEAAPSEAMRRFELLLAQNGLDDVLSEEKIALLRQFPELTPALRDAYGYYLMMGSQVEQAEQVLLEQQALGQASTLTYVMLASMAANHYNFVRNEALLGLAQQAIKTDADRARYFNGRAWYLAKTTHFIEAAQAAAEAYRYAVLCGSVELQIKALYAMSYANQMKGSLPEAIHQAQEALKLASGQDYRFVVLASALYGRLGEMFKDVGRYGEAFEQVQSGLSLQVIKPHPSAAYLYTTRGLIYLELGHLDQAVASFETAIGLFQAEDNPSGLLVPCGFMVYALYRQQEFERLQDYVRLARSCSPYFDQERELEYLAYQPLVEGLGRLARGDEKGALAYLAAPVSRGVLMYDSVLLTRLLLGELLAAQGQYGEVELKELLGILDARSSDVMLAAYARDFPTLVRTATRMGVDDDRFVALLNLSLDQVPSTQTVISIELLGRVSLKVAGTPVNPRSHYGIFLLAYLVYSGHWVTAEDIGEQLFSDLQSPRDTAIQAVNMLRGLLRSVDMELESLLSPKKDRRGYRFEPQANFRVELDVLTWTACLQQPVEGVAQADQVTAALQTLQPLAISGQGRFFEELGGQLTQAQVTAAQRLALFWQERGHPLVAAYVLLLGFSSTSDAGLAERYAALYLALDPLWQVRLPAELDPAQVAVTTEALGLLGLVWSESLALRRKAG